LFIVNILEKSQHLKEEQVRKRGLPPLSEVAYSINNPVDWFANVVLPEEALTETVLIPLHVLGATEYAIDTNLLSPPLNDITDEASTVSAPQLETAEIVTVYRPLPDEQLVIRLKIPTLSPPAVAVDELTVGVATMAHAVEPPPPLPRCANKGSASNTTHTNPNVGLHTQFFILPPRLIEN